MRDGRLLVGWGMATATYPARQLPASALARIRADGTAEVLTGSQDIGTGTYTIMSQIAADALGLPIERVRFDLGDTTFPEAPLSAGSATASSVGSAVRRACLALVDKVARVAVADARSPLHGLDPEAIVATDGGLADTRDHDRSQRYADILRRGGQDQLEVVFHEQEKPTASGSRPTPSAPSSPRPRRQRPTAAPSTKRAALAIHCR